MKQKIKDKIIAFIENAEAPDISEYELKAVHEGYFQVLADLRSKVDTLADEILAEIFGEVKKLKTDERKIASFAEWDVVSYEEKQLANAVLEHIINKLKS